MFAKPTRRELVSLAASAAVLACTRPVFADASPETTSLRLAKIPGICIAPAYVAEELLQAEGFTDIRYVAAEAGVANAQMLARGELDFVVNFVAAFVPLIDAGEPVTVLAGVHPGCFELFADPDIRNVIDLKGRTVGVPALGSSQHLFLASIAAYVGMDPAKDIEWVTSTSPKPMQLFADGKIDAFLGFPPEPQDLRARNVGHVIVNSTLDRPWSQYFCCLLAGNRDFVRANPIATKRVLRAVLKSADLCVTEPGRVARHLVDGGFTARYDLALQALDEIPYGKWRDFDAEELDPLLRPAPTRGGRHPVEPDQDHRRRHRLAVPRPGQARAEGVTAVRAPPRRLPMTLMQSRRDFAATLSLAGAAALTGVAPCFADEGPPEITTIRLPMVANICFAPLYVAEELLRAEGFTEIRYVPSVEGFSFPQMAGRGQIDFGATFAGSVVFHLDAGVAITAVSGVHSGCYELFAHEPVRTIGDLKGRKVSISTLASSGHLYLTIMAAHVGLDPARDIEWVASPDGNPMELFAQGKVDAFLGFPPEPQQLRARGINRVILRTATDRPWSQYLCCMLFGRRDFVRDFPVATKRVVRAILKTADFCANDPAAAAQRLFDRGFAKVYAQALQTLDEVPYDRWREYDAEDALRFYALRLHEVGMIKSDPNQIIAAGADWRFLNELKRELKT